MANWQVGSEGVWSLYNRNETEEREGGRGKGRGEEGEKNQKIAFKVFSKVFFCLFLKYVAILVLIFAYFIIGYVLQANFCQKLHCIHLPFLFI